MRSSQTPKKMQNHESLSKDGHRDFVVNDSREGYSEVRRTIANAQKNEYLGMDTHITRMWKQTLYETLSQIAKILMSSHEALAILPCSKTSTQAEAIQTFSLDIDSLTELHAFLTTCASIGDSEGM